MFKKIGSLSAGYPKTILMFWVILFILAIPFGSRLQDHLGGGNLYIRDSESAEAREFIRSTFGEGSPDQLIFVVESVSFKTDDPHFRNTVERIEKIVKQDSRITHIESPYSAAHSNLLDATRNRAFVFADLNMEEREMRNYVKALKKVLTNTPFPGFQVYVTGSPAIHAEGSQIAKNNVATVEKIGLPIVFVLLLLVFRSVIAALLPLVMGVFTTMLSMAVAYPFAIHMELSQLLTNIITMLGLGVAIDYALFITQRFREELAAGTESRQAVTIAVSTAGRAVFFAGATVAISIISIVFSSTSFAQSIALGGSIVVITSIAASLTLLPAVLTLLGGKINSLSLPLFGAKEGRSYLWAQFVRVVLKRPILFLILVLAPLGSLLPPMFQINMHLPVASYQELPEGSESRTGMEAVAEHLGDGTIFPIQVLLQSERTLFQETAINEVDRIAAQIKGLPNVKEVLSFASFVTKDRPVEQWEALHTNPERLPDSIRERMNQLVSRDGKSTLLVVIPLTEASSEQTRTLVKKIRNEVIPEIIEGFTGAVTGETAIGLDYDAKVIGSFPYVIGSVIILTFIILYVTFRSVLIPLKAILMNLLVTGSTLGFVVLMYQFGYMFGAEPFPLSINTPLTLFVLLFGLSMDYEVILISRMKEQYEMTKDHEGSVAYGIVATSGMVNGAASIMVVVFGVFVMADFQLIQELGVGLAFAIFVDAFLVRSVLVPVFMKLLGRVNWWGFREWANMLFRKYSAFKN